jgi:hypothetical protein
MGDCVAKYLARGLQSTLGQIICAASRDGFQHGDQFRSLDFCDGACADMREDIGFKAPHDLAGMLFAARGLPVTPPFPCYRLKRVFSGRLACQLVGLSDDHGVVAGGQHFAGRVLTFTRLRQRHSGVSAQRQDLLLTEHTVFPAPQLRAGRADKQVQAFAVAQLAGLGARLCLLDGGVCERHDELQNSVLSGNTPNRIPPYPQEYPQQTLACNRAHWTEINEKAPWIGAFRWSL